MEFDVDLVLDVVTRLLPESGVDVILIGGHAVNTYGVSRATQDIDFMIAASHEKAVCRVMHDAGFSNTALYETVMFFSRPGSPFRVDFLKVDEETITKLLANARKVDYLGGHTVLVPRLKDLLAMKLFSLSSGGAKRESKDFFDIVNLTLENGLDLNRDLHPLCQEFGSEEIFNRVCAHIEELNND